MEPQVVVNIKHRVYKHSKDEVLSVRCAALGLTAYGDSEAEAVGNFKQLFNRFINTYREKGRLKEVLNQSGVEWWWRNDYPADHPTFEETNSSAHGTSKCRLELLAMRQQEWEKLNEEQTRDFAIAA